MTLTETQIQRASRRLIATYGSEAWFVAADLAVAASRAGDRGAAEACNRIALAIEVMGSKRTRLQ